MGGGIVVCVVLGNCSDMVKLVAVGLKRTYPTDTFAANNRLKLSAVGLKRTYPTDTFAVNNRSTITKTN
jgi:hypothetical protein